MFAQTLHSLQTVTDAHRQIVTLRYHCSVLRACKIRYVVQSTMMQ